MRAWKKALREDESANIVAAPLAGSKRKAVSIHAPRTPLAGAPCSACLGRRAGRPFPDAAKCALPTGRQRGRGGNSQQIRGGRARQGTCPPLPDSARQPPVPQRGARVVFPYRCRSLHAGVWGTRDARWPVASPPSVRTPADLACFHSSVSTSSRFVAPLPPCDAPLPGRASAQSTMALWCRRACLPPSSPCARTYYALRASLAPRSPQ